MAWGSSNHRRKADYLRGQPMTRGRNLISKEGGKLYNLGGCNSGPFAHRRIRADYGARKATQGQDKTPPSTEVEAFQTQIRKGKKASGVKKRERR